MDDLIIFGLNCIFRLIYAIVWLFSHAPQIILGIFGFIFAVDFISMFLPEKEEKNGPYNPTPQYPYYDDNLKIITNQNEFTRKEFTQNLYCNMCGSEIEESEYYSNSGLCDNCYTDVNIHYDKYGLDDYIKPYKDAIDNYKK